MQYSKRTGVQICHQITGLVLCHVTINLKRQGHVAVIVRS